MPGHRGEDEKPPSSTIITTADARMPMAAREHPRSVEPGNAKMTAAHALPAI
jgi:hypothetical protein